MLYEINVIEKRKQKKQKLKLKGNERKSKPKAEHNHKNECGVYVSPVIKSNQRKRRRMAILHPPY
jgi:hypothetical protein